MSALIEVQFGFDEYNVDIGKIRKGQSVTRTATLIVKDPSIIRTITFSTSSPFITAVITGASATDKGRVNVEVTVKPGLPVGRIDGRINAYAVSGSKLETFIAVRGGVLGNLEISPEYLQIRVDSTGKLTEEEVKIVNITTVEGGTPVHLLSVIDANQRMKFKTDTLAIGKQYQITASPKAEVKKAGKNVQGTVVITTDDKDQPTISIPYNIYFAR